MSELQLLAQLVADKLAGAELGADHHCYTIAVVGQRLLATQQVESRIEAGSFELPMERGTLGWWRRGGGEVFNPDGEFRGHVWLRTGGRVLDFSWLYLPVEVKPFYLGADNRHRKLREGRPRYRPYPVNIQEAALTALAERE